MDGKQVKNKANPTGTGKYLNESGQYVTLPAAGGLTVITGTAVFNFGDEDTNIPVVITNAVITSANLVSTSFIPLETSETSIDDFYLNGVSASLISITDGVDFTLLGTSLRGATGNYSIKYLITIN